MFNNVKLGIAPIGWTNDDMPQLGGELTFEQMVSEAALAGFQGTEVGGKFPTDPAVLNKALDLRGIKIASQWFSSFLCSTPYEENEKAFIEQLDFLEAVGASRINVCELTRCLFAEECSMFGDNKPVATDEEWDKLCDGLNKLGKIAADRGFKLCFHHHMATVVQTFEETKRLMDNTDPRYVSFCIDTAHTTLAGMSPVELIKKVGPRLAYMHLKDVDTYALKTAEGADKMGTFRALGHGTIDFPAVKAALEEIGYDGILCVELDRPEVGNFHSAEVSRIYIRDVLDI